MKNIWQGKSKQNNDAAEFIAFIGVAGTMFIVMGFIILTLIKK
jgi:hypothetical protein